MNPQYTKSQKIKATQNHPSLSVKETTIDSPSSKMIPHKHNPTTDQPPTRHDAYPTNRRPSSEEEQAAGVEALARSNSFQQQQNQQQQHNESIIAPVAHSPTHSFDDSIASINQELKLNDSSDNQHQQQSKRRRLNSSATSTSTSNNINNQNNKSEVEDFSSQFFALPVSPLSLRKIIPPKDCLRIQGRFDSNDPGALKEVLRFDWTAVIERAKSHPHEAAEPYFSPVTSGNTTNTSLAATAGVGGGSNSSPESNHILTYKPLHAMLKYDPPLEAVEAVLRAHPEGALDVTFEGTALKIAAESKVSSMLVLRLLLVAEMAMRKKMKQQKEAEKKSAQQQQTTTIGNLKRNSSDESSHGSASPPTSTTPDEDNTSMFAGHNPIRWITERRIPVKTTAMLLKWYPIGAFQRPWDKDGKPLADDMGCTLHDNMQMNVLDSPLIEIVDDFARDHFDDEGNNRNDNDLLGGSGVYGYDESEMSDDDNIMMQPQQLGAVGTTSTAQSMTMTRRPPKTHEQRERQRKEKRWEKFLHILYAVDISLQSTRGQAKAPETPPTDKQQAEEYESPKTPRAIAEARASAAAAHRVSQQKQTESRFHPVHAWVRCICSPYLGLENAHKYAVWSVLCDMYKRIPEEFREIDDSKSLFQTLAECKATNCKLSVEEIQDIVELIIEADYKSAFIPRQSDGILIGHIAIENGWPCRSLLSKKPSATCA